MSIVMDKSWITASRVSEAYKVGCQSFIRFASAVENQGTIPCPCLKYCNAKRFPSKEVLHHILFKGFCQGYTTWTLYGEHMSSSEYDHFMTNLASQTAGAESNSIQEGGEENDEIGESSGVQTNAQQSHSSNTGEADQFQTLLAECDEKLYEGYKCSKLSFNLNLYHLKCMGNMSNKIFTMLLEFLKDVFPFLTSLPSSAREAKKLCNDLGLCYQKIYACPNDCMLYCGERANQESCHVCHYSKWKAEDDNKSKKLAKVLHYFPLILRLKRIFVSAKTAKDMRWHHMDRLKDGMLRHPADGLAWKAFDDRYPEFTADPCSVRLGLASDWVNPFRAMSLTYSTWPILLVPYNRPPWLCMKQTSSFFMIIPGHKGPSNDIDVFFQPLIQELK